MAFRWTANFILFFSSLNLISPGFDSVTSFWHRYPCTANDRARMMYGKVRIIMLVTIKNRRLFGYEIPPLLISVRYIAAKNMKMVVSPRHQHPYRT